MFDVELDSDGYWRPSEWKGDTISLDYETASDVDLTKVGLDVYTMPRSRPRVLMAAYRINQQKIRQWEAHKGPPPAELIEALRDDQCQKWAFNAQFERIITNRVMGIESPIRNWRCTMCLAYMHCFTGTLEDIGEQIGLPQDKQKLKNGKRLISVFTMPQKISKNQPYEWRNWLTDPQLWEEFVFYNEQDVVSEEFAKTRLIGNPNRPYPVLADEWDFYELDQLINDRGMPVDIPFVNNVIQMSERRKRELIGEMQDITRLDNPNSGAQLLPWLEDRGYYYGDLRKESVEKALNRHKIGELDLSEDCVEILRRRQWSAVRSIDKAYAARKMIGQGGVVRYMYQFGGASRTLRFSGRGVQPQNMKRTPKMLDPEDNDEKLTIATDLIRAGDYNGFDLFINEPMEGLTGCMRSMFRAPGDLEFKVCDYKSVESAGLAWVTNCPKLLKIFHDKLDPYKFFGTLFYGKPYDQITRTERNICKPPMLGCGYRLSAGEIRDGVKTGLLAYADNMGVELTQDESNHGVKVFRTEFVEVKQFWYDCEEAVRYVLTTGKRYTLGYIVFEWMKPYLLIRLPSGRCIFYYKPKLEKRIVPTGRFKKVRSRGFFEDGAPAGELVDIEETYVRHNFSYMGRNQRTTKWERVEGHGGVVTENVVQALTRDILKVGLTRLHNAGFDLRGHSHDEGIVLQKIGDNYFTLELMRELYKREISWAPGFPLDCSGWQAPFYRKA